MDGAEVVSAGTYIDPKREDVEVVYCLTERGMMRPCGLIDHAKHIFQFRGHLRRFYYLRAHKLTLSAALWDRLIVMDPPIQWLEFIDVGANVVYRILMEHAMRYGSPYDGWLSPRWGIPYTLAEIADARGEIIKHSNLPRGVGHAVTR
ncbi:MAG TPA: hypothetical protein VGE45_00490 [Chloroflexia bacterium]|jgi:hypothetical protein